MSDEILSLSSGFPDGDEAQWRAQVEKALKGGKPEKLNSKTYDGLTVKALYREDDWAASSDSAGLPGQFPYVRGTSASTDAYLPWDIRQIISHPSVEQANTDLIYDLEHGVSSIELRIDAEGQRGVCVRTTQDLAKLLDGVRLDLAPIGLDTTGASAASGIEAAALFIAYLEDQKYDSSTLKLSFNVDPIGTLTRTGALSDSIENTLSETSEFTKSVASQFPQSTSLRIDARSIHEAGGSEAQEIAYLAACASAYMRTLVDAVITPDEAASSFLFTLSVGPEYILEIAKIRAARRVWATVAKAFGASDNACTMTLQVVSSRRMLTARDPWVNMLRATASCFAGGVGGADIVTVRPFTDALGLPSKLARRIARNTQIIAQEESNLGKVVDPAGGAWSVAKLADELAETAWSLFQEIEAKDGLLSSLQEGHFQAKVLETRAERLRHVAHRKVQVTGVSDFPLLDETPAEVVKPDLTAILASATPPTGTKPISRALTDLVAASKNGATIEDLSIESEGELIDPLWPVRLAKPFERLRKFADAYAEKKGGRPKIFLAAIGKLADHTARVGFATNFFAAGGIEAVPVTGGAEALGKAFEASGCEIACICGSDTDYGALASDVARQLGAAGVTRLYLAGRPLDDYEASWREAGIDEFIHVGVNVVAVLELAHSELGLTL